MIYLYSSLILVPIFVHADSRFFDRYSGHRLHKYESFSHNQRAPNKNCTIEIAPCTPNESRRVDGTCNNFNRPSRGSARGPYLRMLTPDYGSGGSIRENRNGEPLPSARKVRTTLQLTGRVEDKIHFSIAASTLLDFIRLDVSVPNGPLDYLRVRQYCCEEKGRADPRCAPIYVPKDDPYLKITGIRCLNYSRSETFQDSGCLPMEKYPEQVNIQTPVLDLSTIYGNSDNDLMRIRKYNYGLLLEVRNKTKYYPANETADICFGNKMNGSACYRYGYSAAGNYDMRTAAFSVFFYREHNRIARILHKMNPCWTDDRLFKIARQINIATAANMFLYELLPNLLGYQNMIDYGLISDKVEFITAYKKQADPLTYAEFEIAFRFFRTFVDGRIKKYNEQYRYVGELSFSETMFRTEVLQQDNNFEDINRGIFFQHAAKIDDIEDPEMVEYFYAAFQNASDQAAIDIQKGRDFGLQGYNSYRRLCGLKTAKKFEDFIDTMSFEKMEALKYLYEDIEDVEMLPGIMSENFIPGTFVGPTLFCIIAKQIRIFRLADRFWFERGHQYHSFTLPQLNEIRRTNMARFACDNAEGIKYIQPQALLNIGHGNTPVPCSHIPGPDFSKWYDGSCKNNKDQFYPTLKYRPRYFKEEEHYHGAVP